MENPFQRYYHQKWQFFKDKESASGNAIDESKFLLLDNFNYVSDVIYSKCFISLSRGYYFSGRIQESVDVLLDLLYLIPEEMMRVPKRGKWYLSLSKTICECKKQLLLVLSHILSHQTPPASNSNENNAFNNNLYISVKSNLIAISDILLTMPSGQTPAPEILDIKEDLTQCLVYLDVTDPRHLAALGRAQLDQFELNPKWANSEIKLRQAIMSYEMAILAETATDAELFKNIKEQDWFSRYQSEANFIKTGLKTFELKSNPSNKSSVGKNSSNNAAVKTSKSTTATSAASKNAPKTAASVKTASSGSSKVAPVKTSTAKKDTSTPVSKAQNEKNNKSRPVTASNSNAITSNTDSDKNVITPKKNLTDSELFHSRVGLARALNRELIMLDEKKIKSTSSLEYEKILDKVKCYYSQAIDILPQSHDAYIELGAILEKRISIAVAADLYSKYPFKPIDDETPSEDDMYLYSELSRTFMREKRYKDPMLLKSLTAEGRAFGLTSLTKYIEALDNAGESKLLMNLYAFVNKKPVDHPDLVPFFKSKFWI